MKAITKTIRINRLTKLHDFLRELKPKQFNFGSFIEEKNKELTCGTICCAVGWLPAVDKKNWEWELDRTDELVPIFNDNYDAEDSAKEYFGIGYELFSDLFMPSMYNDADVDGLHNLDAQATPKQVAKNIMRAITLLKENKLNDYLV